MEERGRRSEGGKPQPESRNPDDFDALDLVAAIRALSAAGRTGTLTVSGPEGEERRLYFQDGLVKLVCPASPQGDTLEEALLGSRCFSREEVGSAREEARGSDRSLAEVLLERGAGRGLDAGKVLDQRTCQEAARILAWKEARCRFSEGAGPRAEGDPYAARLCGGIDAESILESLRRAAEGLD